MKMIYIPRIQGNMKGYRTIHTNKATSRIIDGSYNSIYKGRSMNFDELREYVIGDDIKDVDWKASARSRRMLVRQYTAEKKHNVMLIMDTNRRMLANINDIQEKYDAAILAAGTLAYMVSGNGDYISATFSENGAVRHFPFSTGIMNVESILAGYDRAVTDENVSELEQPLEFIAKNFRRRMIILIVTDARGIQNIPERLVRQLMALHDVILVGVNDADAFGDGVFDMAGGSYIPEFFSKDKKLIEIERGRRLEIEAECRDKLKRLGVSFSMIDNTDDMDEQIVGLLEKHKLECRAKA